MEINNSDQLNKNLEGFNDNSSQDSNLSSPTNYSDLSPVKDNSSKKKPAVLLAILLLVIGLAGAGFVFYMQNQSGDGDSILKPMSQGGDESEQGIAAPLTGVLYPENEVDEWINVRPLGIMINNHVSARPQSGLIDADLVYEVVAEGGITRFLAFFNTEVPEKIGPVRSTREYYLVLVKELGDAMVMHIGWSPQALEAIQSWPVRSLGRGGAQFWRDEDRLAAGVPTEHTAYVDGQELLDLGMTLGWEGTSEDFDRWLFKGDNLVDRDAQEATPTADPIKPTPPIANGTANIITIDFWFPGDYSAIWNYDATSQTYLRYMGYDATDQPIPHKDQETGEQIAVSNLIVQFAPESNISGDDKGRLEYDLVGSGQGLVFMDGQVYNVTWSKSDRDARTFFFFENGEEVVFNRGKFWISIVPDRNVEQVTYL